MISFVEFLASKGKKKKKIDFPLPLNNCFFLFIINCFCLDFCSVEKTMLPLFLQNSLDTCIFVPLALSPSCQWTPHRGNKYIFHFCWLQHMRNQGHQGLCPRVEHVQQSIGFHRKWKPSVWAGRGLNLPSFGFLFLGERGTGVTDEK